MSIKCMRGAKFKRSCDTFSSAVDFFSFPSFLHSYIGELKYFLHHIKLEKKEAGKNVMRTQET